MTRKSYLAIAKDKHVDEKADRPVVVDGGSERLPQSGGDMLDPPHDVR